MIKILELFAGSKSVGKIADGLFFESYSSDIEQFGGIDYVIDILDFDVTKIPFKPDVIVLPLAWQPSVRTGQRLVTITYLKIPEQNLA